MHTARIPVSIGIAILTIVTLGVMARAVTCRSPLFDFHSWRQADTAAISRNFIEDRFNPLYPQVDWRGEQADGFVETGLELHAFTVAALAKVLGFSTTLGRAVNVAGFMVAALLLFSFARLRYGESVALVALFIYSMGLPLTLYMDRAFMNESMLALLTIACLWSAHAYCARARVASLAVLIVASALIATVKPTYLIVWGPVFGFFLERFGKSAFLRWEVWLAGALTLVAGGLWFAHARTLFEQTGLSFGLYEKLLNTGLLSSPEYPLKVATRLAKDIFGPLPFVAVPAGVVVALRREKYAEALGVLAFVLYLIVVAEGNFHHNYYQLPIVPVGTVLASLAIVAGIDAARGKYSWDSRRVRIAYASVLWIVAVSTFVRSTSAHNWYEIDRDRQRLCEELRPLLQAGDRLIFVNDKSPDMLFCVARPGWLLTEEESTAIYILHLVQKGASVVVTRQSDPLNGALEGAGQRLLETPRFRAYRLAPAR